MKCATHIMERFASYERELVLHRANALLHICEANASFTNLKVYDILNSKAGVFMRDDKLSIQSMDFAVSIINLVKELKLKKENIISNQK
ncbi:MAG: hypothetical protein IJ944_05445 [Clostridia bacterium]|nr:hypothetical protein [Clostridia bacterium]